MNIKIEQTGLNANDFDMDQLSLCENGLRLTDEQKEDIEKAAEAAINWWLDNIFLKPEKPLEDSIENFKNVLRSKIKIGLYHHPDWFYLGYDFINFDKDISVAREEAGLRYIPDIMLSPEMIISSDKVEAGYRFKKLPNGCTTTNSEYEVIYESKKKTNFSFGQK